MKQQRKLVDIDSLNGSSLSLNIKSICDILRRDDGVGVKFYILELSWIMFLKIYEDREKYNIEFLWLDKSQVVLYWTEYSWSSWTQKEEYRKNPDKMLYFVKKQLFPYLQNINKPWTQLLRTIFANLKETRIRYWTTLIDVVDKISQIDFSFLSEEDSHILSKAYEELLSQMWTEWGWAGEYYTPRPVVKFIVNILNPDIKNFPNMKVLDPFAWSGGFLVETFKYNFEKYKDTLSQFELFYLKTKAFYWIEKKFEAYLVGLMNLFLHWIEDPHYELWNTFTKDLESFYKKFDFVLTNPPFGGKEAKSTYEAAEFADYKTSSTEALGLQFVMKSLKVWWKAWIILPAWQILFGWGVFQKIREQLIQNFNLKYIIFLPEGTFSSVWTGIKTAILIFENSWPTKKTRCFRINWKYTKKNTIKYEDLKPLVDYILGKEINLPENVEETVIDWERLELLKKNLNQFIEKFTKFSENELVEVINEFENFIKTNDFYKDKDKLEKLYILQLIDDVRRDSKNKDKLIEWLKAEIEKFDYSFMVSFWKKEEEKVDLNELIDIIDTGFNSLLDWWQNLKENLKQIL